MSEISTEIEYPSSLSFPEEQQESQKDWEDLGCMAFYANAFISLSAYIPATIKKKRTYTVGPVPFLGPSVPQLAQVIQQSAIETEVEQAAYSCNHTLQAKINQLFTKIADATTWELIWRGVELQRIGAELRSADVHPLGLLSCAPKHKMHDILTSGNPMKTNSFMNNITHGLEQEHLRGNLLRHVETFAQEVQKDEAHIRQLIQALDWTSLVYYLFDVRV